MAREVSIGKRMIGLGHRPYIIAEMSANHLGSLDRAMRILEAARKAGADALKLQTYTADTMTIDHDGPGFTISGGLWGGRTLHSLYAEAHTPWEWHDPLFERGRQLGIDVFSSPFDEAAVKLLSRLDAPAYKIASFEIVDLPLIRRCAAEGRPLIVSTGMASMPEIAAAVATAREGGAEVILLHAVSGYPTRPAEFNLRRVANLAGAFDCPVGISDHTLGLAVPVAGVALGAVVIEKHLTLARSDGGPDGAFSMEPQEFAQMVQAVRDAFDALGTGEAGLAQSESPNRIFRRSLYVVEDVRAGEALNTRNVRAIRPAHGLPPGELDKVIGRKASRDLKRGDPLDWSMVGGGS
jgi:pseudaminic acid synthase